ncbi:hypothetical protein LZ32DRAFT_143670 [Colletotrichum eremochloae]|nr:hypothetical protein LZ32DRAFT_143670 [Colletotrichum eremochloae]
MLFDRRDARAIGWRSRLPWSGGGRAGRGTGSLAASARQFGNVARFPKPTTAILLFVAGCDINLSEVARPCLHKSLLRRRVKGEGGRRQKEKPKTVLAFATPSSSKARRMHFQVCCSRPFSTILLL